MTPSNPQDSEDAFRYSASLVSSGAPAPDPAPEEVTYTDVSIDCETLSLDNYPFLLSVAVVPFNLDVDHVGDHGTPYYWRIHGKQPDAHIEERTLRWWMCQDERVRAETFGGLIIPEGGSTWAPVLANDTASTRAATFYLEFMTAIIKLAPERIWVRGVDHVWLASHLTGAGYQPPWSYKSIVDLRSVESVAKRAGYPPSEIPKTAPNHSALTDAVFQLTLAQDIFRWMSRT